MANEDYGGQDRRSQDSTARQMAEDARSRADGASKDVAVIGERLAQHLTACAVRDQETSNALKSIRGLLWGLLITVLAAVFSAFFVMLTSKMAVAHDGARPDHDAFYSRLMLPNGASCCSRDDCRPIPSDRWRINDGRYEVRWMGEWIPAPVVPRPKGVPGPGQAVLCVFRGQPRCFTPGVLM